MAAASFCGADAARGPGRSRAGLSIVPGHTKVFVNDLTLVPTVLQALTAQDVVREGPNLESA